LREIAQKGEFPFGCQGITHKSLVVQKRGPVFSLGVEGAEQVGIGLVAHTVYLPELAVFGSLPHKDIGTEQTYGCRAFEFFRFFVADIQHRGHFVSVHGFEAAGRKLHLVGHTGIYKTQSFLLAAANQQGTVNFHAIDIDQVFVVISSPDRILGTQFVVGTHSGKSNQQSFYAAARRVGQKADTGNVDFFQTACSSLLCGHYGFVQGFGTRCQDDIQHQLIDFDRDDANGGLIRQTTVIEDQGVLPGQLQFIITALIAGGTFLTVLLKNIDQFNCPFVGIHHKTR